MHFTWSPFFIMLFFHSFDHISIHITLSLEVSNCLLCLIIVSLDLLDDHLVILDQFLIILDLVYQLNIITFKFLCFLISQFSNPSFFFLLALQIPIYFLNFSLIFLVELIKFSVIWFQYLVVFCLLLPHHVRFSQLSLVIIFHPETPSLFLLQLIFSLSQIILININLFILFSESFILAFHVIEACRQLFMVFHQLL